jgi:hypothetical protein
MRENLWFGACLGLFLPGMRNVSAPQLGPALRAKIRQLAETGFEGNVFDGLRSCYCELEPISYRFLMQCHKFYEVQKAFFRYQKDIDSGFELRNLQFWVDEFLLSTERLLPKDVFKEKLLIVLTEVRKRVAAKLFPWLQAFVAELDEQKLFACQSNTLYSELLTLVKYLTPDLWQTFLEGKGDEFKKQEKVVLSGYWQLLLNTVCLNILDVKMLSVAALHPGLEDRLFRSRFYDWFIQHGFFSRLYEDLREHSPHLSCWFLNGQGFPIEDEFEEDLYDSCIKILLEKSFDYRPIPALHICLSLRAGAHDGKLAAFAEKFHACIDRIAEIPREYWMWIHAVKLLGCLVQRRPSEKSSSVNLLAPDMFGAIALFVVPKSILQPA